MAEQQPADNTQQEPQHHNTSARVVLAAAFAWTGLKLGLAGMIADGGDLLKGKPKRFGTLKSELSNSVAQKMVEGVSKNKARLQVFKYTSILAGIGAASGAALGLTRGDKINKTSDIFHHPIKSVKLVLGFKPDAPQNFDSPNTNTSTTIENSATTADDKITDWVEQISKSAQTAAGQGR